jgi:hypothetical protein
MQGRFTMIGKNISIHQGIFIDFRIQQIPPESNSAYFFIRYKICNTVTLVNLKTRASISRTRFGLSVLVKVLSFRRPETIKYFRPTLPSSFFSHPPTPGPFLQTLFFRPDFAFAPALIFDIFSQGNEKWPGTLYFK